MFWRRASPRLLLLPLPRFPPLASVARQRILTVDEKVYGYELLFRDGIENHFRETDADTASRRTLDTSLQMGLELLWTLAEVS
jgi:hypothetical protein